MRIKVLGFCLSALSFSLHAAPQAPTRTLPLEIKADHLLVQQKKGIATYNGHVVAQQGQFFLYGDRLEVHVKTGKIRQVIAYGNPAKFKKFDPKKNGWIHGQARKIIYRPAPHKQLQLITAAQVTQAGGETLSSDQILYRVDSQTLAATGSKQQRVHVILPAEENP